jgi:hypothetical protein
MKTPIALLLVVLLAGCALPQKTVHFDSDPPGARVFMASGMNEGMAKTGRNYLGTTPCQWTTEVNRDLTFRIPRDSIPFYSDLVQPVIVFTAEPPSGATNLFIRREIFHDKAAFQAGNKVPDGIFFDLTRPDPPRPVKSKP